MDRAKRGNPQNGDWRLLLKMAWLDVALLALGVLAVGAALYLRDRPEWTLREDILHLNKGVTAFNEPPGLLPPGDGRPAEYPIERAGWHWGQTTAMSTDLKVKALADYNLGTLVGREAWAQSLAGPGNARLNMADGIRKLGEALRTDPTNEDAKFNLELMERSAQPEGVKEGAPGPGYSPGGVQKGY